VKKKHGEKIEQLTESINSFIKDIKDKRKTTIEMGRKALKIDSKSQIDFWIIQYKLTEQYEKQSLEMLGQLDIAKYSNEMQKSAKQFFDCMEVMAKQLSKIFGYTSIKDFNKSFDKRMINYETSKEKNQDLIEETSEQFRNMQESFSDSNDIITIDEKERKQILAVFNKPLSSQLSDEDLLKKLFN